MDGTKVILGGGEGNRICCNMIYYMHSCRILAMGAHCICRNVCILLWSAFLCASQQLLSNNLQKQLPVSPVEHIGAQMQ